MAKKRRMRRLGWMRRVQESRCAQEVTELTDLIGCHYPIVSDAGQWERSNMLLVVKWADSAQAKLVAALLAQLHLKNTKDQVAASKEALQTIKGELLDRRRLDKEPGRERLIASWRSAQALNAAAHARAHQRVVGVLLAVDLAVDTTF